MYVCMYVPLKLRILTALFEYTVGCCYDALPKNSLNGFLQCILSSVNINNNKKSSNNAKIPISNFMMSQILQHGLI